MSAPPDDRLVHDARIGPDDSPHEAAAHLWAQIVARHDVDPEGPLARLGVFDRTVLVLHDVLGLSSSTVAEVLHTEEAAVVSAHAAARTRIGLPRSRAGDCRVRDALHEAHAPGDPAVLDGLVAHATACSTCRDSIAEEQRRTNRWWPARSTAAAATGTAVAAPALAGTLAAAAAIVAAGATVGALVGPMPEPPLPDPVVVDADPSLPSDEEPEGGWDDERLLGTGAENGDTTEQGDSTAGGEDTAQDSAQQDSNNGITDSVEDLGEAIDETVNDLGETIDETVDDVGDALHDTADDATDTLDSTTDDATDSLEDTTDAVTDTVEDADDALDGTVRDTTDVLP